MKTRNLLRFWLVLLVISVLFPSAGVQAAPAEVHSRAAIMDDYQPEDVVPGSAIITLKGTALESQQSLQAGQPGLYTDLRQMGVEDVISLSGGLAPREASQVEPGAQAAADDMPAFIRRTYEVRFSETRVVAEMVAAIKTLPEVQSAQPNFIYKLDAVPPNDPHYQKNQWGLKAIHAEEAWNQTQGDDQIFVAVIDTGADVSHPDLVGKLVPGWDYVDEDSLPQDENGHGSHVAGIIAASTDNGIGVAGVAWKTRVLVQRVCKYDTCDTQAIVRALIDAANTPQVRVINLSLGSYQIDPLMKDAVGYAYDKFKTVVAAAGNDNTSEPHYPASFDHVISVAAVDQSLTKAGFSNYGYAIDFCAPGVDIVSPTFKNIFLVGKMQGYYNMSGTSMAAPMVSGVAALVYSGLPEVRRKAMVVEDILKNTAQDLGDPGSDRYYGHGLVNAGSAVSVALQPPFLSLSAWRYTGKEVPERNAYIVRVRDPGTHKLVFEQTITIPPNGFYSQLPLSGVGEGYYDVYLYNFPFLSREALNVHFTPGKGTPLLFSEQGQYGDFNYDDEVNMVDLDTFLKNYHTIKEFAWDLDLNGDGKLNYIDFGEIAKSFNKKGKDFSYKSKLPTDVLSIVTEEGDALDAQAANTNAAGSFTMNPSSGAYAVGSEFDLNISLNTGGATINGSDIRIRYDSCSLDALSITSGSLFPGGTQGASTLPESGEVSFLNGNVNQPFNGTGTLATIRFRVKAATPSAGVWVYYKPAQTNDSNIVDTASGSDMLGFVGHAMFNLVGGPARETLNGTLTPGPSAYLTHFDIPLRLNLSACNNIIADSVTFEAQYDGAWHTLTVDRNKNNGWGLDWNNAMVPDQQIALRAIVQDINQGATTIQSGSILLDRTAPETTLYVPDEIPESLKPVITWHSTDAVSGVKLVELQYRAGFDGEWQNFTSGNGMGWAALPITADTLYFVRARAQDNAGNWSSFTSPQPIGPRVYLPTTSK